MGVTLTLLNFADDQGDWVMEGQPIRFEEDTVGRTAQQRARDYGDHWVSQDPERRKYIVSED